MASRKKARKGPHCKMVPKKNGGKRKMCFNAKGKITKNPR